MFGETSNLKKYFLPTTLIVVCCLNVTLVSSSERVAGVKQGEWVEYKIEWEDYPYSDYQTMVRREILDSNGPMINVNITIWYSNGTITKEIMTGDVSEGTGAAALIFIPANLTIGDTVHIQGLNEIKIKREEEREYIGFQRKVIYSEFSSKGFYVSIYWDKIKGVALEINSKHILSESEKIYDYETKVHINGTNMFIQSSNNASDFGWIFPMVIFIIVASVLIIQRRWINRKKRLHRRKARLSKTSNF